MASAGQPPQQVCIQILLRRVGDKLEVRLGRSDRMGQPAHLEHQHLGDAAQPEDTFVAAVSEYMIAIFKELK